jgi:uncharacterized damage-inducible protein DinB
MPSGDVLALSSDGLLRHWQGHRSLTRRAIEAFPEEQLFGHSIGGMRPFSELAHEMIRLAEGGIRGLATGDWGTVVPHVSTKEELLRLWDRTTDTINRVWAELPEGWFTKAYAAFGQWEAAGWVQVFYWIDNEIHHRGQGYVYLRSLGIEPPPFYERS